jgi:hypothetical protein
MELPRKLRISQLADTIPCTVRHIYDMRREGLVETTQNGPGKPHYLSREQWQDYWRRLEDDRRRLKKPHLRFPVTKAGRRRIARACNLAP